MQKKHLNKIKDHKPFQFGHALKQILKKIAKKNTNGKRKPHSQKNPIVQLFSFVVDRENDPEIE